jgi:hypothetical protein
MDRAGQSIRSQPPNWVDKVTLAVLTVTLIVVGLYTYQAWRQSNQLVLQNRPVVFVNRIFPLPGAPLIHDFPPAISVVIVNFGKTVGLDVAAPGELVSERADSKVTPQHTRCNSGTPPANPDTTALAQVDAISGNPSFLTATWRIKPENDLAHRGICARTAVFRLVFWSSGRSKSLRNRK